MFILSDKKKKHSRRSIDKTFFRGANQNNRKIGQEVSLEMRFNKNYHEKNVASELGI